MQLAKLLTVYWKRICISLEVSKLSIFDDPMSVRINSVNWWGTNTVKLPVVWERVLGKLGSLQNLLPVSTWLFFNMNPFAPKDFPVLKKHIFPTMRQELGNPWGLTGIYCTNPRRYGSDVQNLKATCMWWCLGQTGWSEFSGGSFLVLYCGFRLSMRRISKQTGLV